MSEEKLKLSQKLFAALERLIRDTCVYDVDLEWEATTQTNTLDFTIPVGVTETSVTIETERVEIVSRLAHPVVKDASLEALTTHVTDENVELIKTTTVIDESLQLTTTTRIVDLLRQSTLASPPGSSLVKNIEISRLKPGIHRLPETKLKIAAAVKENLAFFRRLTVQKTPVVLSFLSEKEQLVFWKQAVTQTGKEARYLQILGVYTGVPYDCIENFKVNYSQKLLNYNFKARFYRAQCELRDIALFNDMTEDKILMVV